MYRIENIYVYRDKRDESQLIKLILNYMDTPQYLRKRLFIKRPELQYVGILPPLRTPHHSLKKKTKQLKKGELREGVVIHYEDETFFVDIGVEKPLKAKGHAPSIGSRTTIRITETIPDLKGEFISKKEPEKYWGYSVRIVNDDIRKILSTKKFDLKIATSRKGIPYPQIESKLSKHWIDAKKILIAFGTPRKGLVDIFSDYKVELQKFFDFVINMIPEQGCETIRTEEAIQASLAILNLLSL